MILPEGEKPDLPGSQDYETLDEDMLASLVFDQGWNFKDYRGSRAPRLSLAGAQNKTTVALDDGGFGGRSDVPPHGHRPFDPYSQVRSRRVFQCPHIREFRHDAGSIGGLDRGRIRPAQIGAGLLRFGGAL